MRLRCWVKPISKGKSMKTERFRRNQQVQVISDRPCMLCTRSHQGKSGYMV